MIDFDRQFEDTTRMASKNVMVLIDDSNAGSFEAITDSIEKSGVHVERVMRGMKTIVGVAKDDNAIERVRHLSGVSFIREDKGVQLPPMDPSIPQ